VSLDVAIVVSLLISF